MTTTTDINRFLERCLDISGEHDQDALLSKILDTSIDIVHCDAGILYLLEDDRLHFCRMQSRSQMQSRSRIQLHDEHGHDVPIHLPPIPMEDRYICAWAALHKTPVSVDDIYIDKQFDHSRYIYYDKLTGYRTVSMLAVPMFNEEDRLIGVIRLLNALSDDGSIIPFAPEDKLLVSAIASQAAISITNLEYADQISRLLDSLVQSLATAVDERSAYTGNHTRHMVKIAEHFLDWLEDTGNDWRFDAHKRKVFLMSVWIHDIGKLTIPLRVMDKASRLGDLMPQLEERLRVIGLLDRIAMLEGTINAGELSERNRRREDILDFILEINSGKPLFDEDIARIEAISGLTYIDEAGKTRPWITDKEKTCLLIGKGTLTAQERKIMENHAVMTKLILEQVTFPEVYAQVPVWASAHHEFLNGKGYPEHISGNKIPPETRLLTILDIFEAMTAKDRPYKGPMTLERALTVLDDMAENGQIDKDILSLFKKSKAWEGVI